MFQLFSQGAPAGFVVGKVSERKGWADTESYGRAFNGALGGRGPGGEGALDMARNDGHTSTRDDHPQPGLEVGEFAIA